MKLQFYTPSCTPEANTFGAATLGFADAEDALCACNVTFPVDLDATLVHGSYAECLRTLPDRPCQAAIVLLANAGGEDAFIRALAARVRAPLVGGGAAIDPVSGRAGLVTGGGQAAVLLIHDPHCDVQVCCENIHHDILSTHHLTYTTPRVLDAIDGVDAATWLRMQKQRLGLAPTDFEHLTFSDPHGINVHLSEQNGRICAGRDLSPQMQLRYLPADQVLSRMQRFYDDENAITFGCAGLKGILPQPMAARGLGLFLFGEVCTQNGHSAFGNLMLSKLRILPRT